VHVDALTAAAVLSPQRWPRVRTCLLSDCMAMQGNGSASTHHTKLSRPGSKLFSLSMPERPHNAPDTRLMMIHTHRPVATQPGAALVVARSRLLARLAAALCSRTSQPKL
jgi:hypothetical protein